MAKEYIERGVLLKNICNACDGWCNNTNCDCVNCKSDHRCDIIIEIADTPAADVVEVVHGRWEVAYTNKQNKTTGVECSECGAFYKLNLFDFGLCYNFCPNCGARMDGE